MTILSKDYCLFFQRCREGFQFLIDQKLKNSKCRWSAEYLLLWEGVHWGRWKCSRLGKGSGQTLRFGCSLIAKVCAEAPHRWLWICTQSNLRGLCASQCVSDWCRTDLSQGPKGYRRDRWSRVRFWRLSAHWLLIWGDFRGVLRAERRLFPFHPRWLYQWGLSPWLWGILPSIPFWWRWCQKVYWCSLS